MRIVLLYLGALANVAIACGAVLTHRPELFWWALVCGLLLALSALLAPEEPRNG
jgi:hypothetical protein